MGSLALWRKKTGPGRGVPGDVTQPVVSGHESRVAGPEAMPLGSIRLGTLFLKRDRGQSVLQQFVLGLFLRAQALPMATTAPTHMDHVKNGGATEG